MGNDYQLVTSAAIRTVDILLCEEDADVAAQAKDFLAKHPIGPVPTEQDMGAGPGDDRILRGVRVLDKYYLFIWDTYQTTGSHHYLGYRFVAPNGVIINQGTDYGVPRIESIDSDEVVSGLLRWFVVDPEEGETLTPQQEDFIWSDDAEHLRQILHGEIEGAERPFTDLPEYEHGEPEE